MKEFLVYYAVILVVLIILLFVVKKLEKKMVKPGMNKYIFKYYKLGGPFTRKSVLEKWKINDLRKFTYIYVAFLDERIILKEYLQEVWKGYKGDPLKVKVYKGGSIQEVRRENLICEYLIREGGVVIF